VREMEAGKQGATHLMLSSSFLPGHQAPTPMRLPPLGLTVCSIISKGGSNEEVIPTASIVDGAVGQCIHRSEPKTYIWSIGGVSAVATRSEEYTDSKHMGLSSQTSRRSPRTQSRTLIRKRPANDIHCPTLYGVLLLLNRI